MEMPKHNNAQDFRAEIKVNTFNTYTYIHGHKRQSLNPLISKTLGFIDKTSRQMGEDFNSRFTEYQMLVRTRPESSILDFLKRKNLNLPQFALFDAIYAREFLDEAGFKNEYIGKDSLLMVFQFPKPIAAFWFKENSRTNKKNRINPHIGYAVKKLLDEKIPSPNDQRFLSILSKDKSDSGLRPVEWGRFMRPLTKLFWTNIKLYSVKSTQLEFNRINGEGDHDADMYHYMFEVKFPNKKKSKAN